MKKVWIAVGVISVILVMTGISVYRQTFAKGPSVNVTQPVYEEISNRLMIPGTVTLGEEQRVYSLPEKGELQDIFVEEGDKIKEGTLLARYDDQQLLLELGKNKLQIKSNYLRINQIEKQINDLYDKEKELTKQFGKEEAKEQVKLERDQLNADKEIANLDLQQTLLQETALEQQIKNLEIKSKVDGIVLQINEQTSQDPLANAKPIIHIGSPDAMIASGLLSEFDTLKVKEGQEVILRSDAVPENKWNGRVSKIGPVPEEKQTAAQTEKIAAQYPITVDIKSKVTRLRPGFQLIMEIETEKKKALTIPADAVTMESDQAFVYIVKDSKAMKKDVRIGISSGNKMEIVSGLTKQDRIIINPAPSLKGGMEVNEK